jgi:hypothetical protein
LFACVEETIEHDDAAAPEEALIDGFVSVFLRERIEENAEEEEEEALIFGFVSDVLRKG